MWQGLVSLTDLNIISNNITKVQSGAFIADMDEPGVSRPLQKLKNLYLMSKIKEIEAGAFQGLNNLTWLGLSLNKLTDITPGAFVGLDSLNHLQ